LAAACRVERGLALEVEKGWFWGRFGVEDGRRGRKNF